MCFLHNEWLQYESMSLNFTFKQAEEKLLEKTACWPRFHDFYPYAQTRLVKLKI